MLRKEAKLVEKRTELLRRDMGARQQSTVYTRLDAGLREQWDGYVKKELTTTQLHKKGAALYHSCNT